MKQKMKIKLLMQSLSPLFLLTMIKNWNFCTEKQGNTITTTEFIKVNLVIICMLIVCGVWLFLSLLFFIQFRVFTISGKIGGYQVTHVKKDEETSLNFFITIILPVLVSDINEIQGAVVFGIIILLICLLLYKTNLFFYNPILNILGYHFYKFQFVENSAHAGEFIGISVNCISDDMVCEYKAITDRVFYIVGEKNGKRKN